ncbi:uncharacterized protein N7506_001578 [Penicillium brevicompactum]|uniref:uncharacterized protein n=1 Tax=Penicillium brevicompactum TaxID=5074 RepID=UPI0025416489|nr:uncharacterized protein N7506_001578 [Penicillium brevicompactum]KAJ5348325.1 hypothetical protein N7506_001578 [Penicillium brevicompactum]
MLFTSIFPALRLATLFLHVSFALAYPHNTTYPLTVIEKFTVPVSFENIATRRDGHLLVTSVESSILRQVSPFGNKNSVAIASIPGATSLLGIAELKEDVFYVVAANVSSTTAIPGTNAVWEIDLRDSQACFSARKDRKLCAKTTLIAKVESAGLLNGMCRLSTNDDSTLLIADSAAGNVVKLNVDIGSYETIINDKQMKNNSTGLQVAINGVHVYGTWLYFTNLNQGIFARVPLDLSNGTVTGPVEVIVNNTPGDDFIISRDGGKAWIAMNGHSHLVEVDINRKTAKVVVDSTYLASASAVSFGRTQLDRNSLYISSAGVLNPAKPGNHTVGGIVARVDL